MTKHSSKPQAIAKIGISGAIWNPNQVLIEGVDGERDLYLKPAGEDEVLARIARGERLEGSIHLEPPKGKR